MAAPGNEPLDYQPRPTTAARTAAKLRAGIIVAAILLIHVVILLLFHPLIHYSENQMYLGGGIIGTPASPVTVKDNDDFNNLIYAIQASLYLIILLVTQWLFLRRPGSWRLDKVGGARLTPASAIIAGLIAMLLCIGLLATLMELPGWWRLITLQHPENEEDYRQRFWLVWMVMFLFWGFWAWLFWVYYRNLDRYTFTGKVLRQLLVGTLIEIFIAALAHTWVVRTRGSECYCTRGSYTGVVFGVTALVWLFGPGVWFLLQREKRRRERLEVDLNRA